MLLHCLRKKYFLILLHLLVLSSEGYRKSKKVRDLKVLPPKFEIYPDERLPSDVQVTKYLTRGKTEIFSYWSTLTNGTLSVSIIPCTSSIQWSFTRSNENEGKSKISDFYISNIFTTKQFQSKQGLYFLSLKAIDNETFAHIYISTEFGGPQALNQVNSENLKIYEKEKRKSASIKWNQSLVDPQSTDYCLVISTKKSFDSLCSAQAVKFDLPPPKSENFLQEDLSNHKYRWKKSTSDNTIFDDPVIACTGKKTYYLISNLRDGQTYHYDLFAINKQSNFTYPYGSISAMFKSQKKQQISLKNGYGQASFRKIGEKAVFRYKIGRDIRNNFDIFVIPCGGPVDLKISLRGKKLITSRKIEGFRKFSISNPVRGARYLIKIFVNAQDDFRRTTSVEVYASPKALSKIPMITNSKLEEYVSLRGCHSVTIGWILVPEPKTLNYCVEVKEGTLKDVEDYRKNLNQCGLEKRLKKSIDFVSKYCTDIKPTSNGKVNTYKIRELKPGKSYTVQVTVKKPKGKTLSYDLLQVSTRKCGNLKLRKN